MVSTRWSLTTKRAVVIGLATLVLLGIYLLGPVLPPVLLGIVLAVLLRPVVDGLERRAPMPRWLAVTLAFLALLVILALMVVLIVPTIWNQVATLWHEQAQGLVDDIAQEWSRSRTVLGQRFSLQDLAGDVPATLPRLLPPVGQQAISLVLTFASSVLWSLAILLIAFYLVRDTGRWRAFADRFTPAAYREELRWLRGEMSTVWTQFLRGQLVLCLIVGLSVWIAMTAVGLPNAALMGLLAGVLEMIPNFGATMAAIPAVLTALLRGSTYLPLSGFWFMILVAAAYLVIQQIENNLLVPRIMSRRMHIHPVIVFIGILAGGHLFGVLGVLMAAPVLGTLRVLLRYAYAKLMDQDPIPPAPVPVEAEIFAGEIDGILFDLDGTLIETDDQAVQALAARLRPVRRILPGQDPERAARRMVMAWEGPTNRILGLLDRVGLDDEVMGLGKWLGSRRAVRPPAQFRAVDGVVAVLHDLHRRYRLGVVTTRSHREAEAFLSQHGLREVVEVVAGRDDTWRIKPDPSPILHAARALGIAAERCVMVGDTPVDVRAAKAAGARAVGVLCGFGRREELVRAGADLVVETTSALSDLF